MLACRSPGHTAYTAATFGTSGSVARGRGRGRRSLAAVRAGSLDLLANAYVRARPAREFLDVKSGSEAGLRAGVGYGIAPFRAWIPRRIYLELEGRSFLRAGFAAGSAPAEWRLGGTLGPAGNLAIDVAGGSALTDGVGAPRARFLLGLGWSPAACSQRYANEQLARAVPPVPRGFGPTRPVATNGTVEGRAANRRVAFTVVKTRARVIEAEMHPSHEVPHTLKRKCITSPSWTT